MNLKSSSLVAISMLTASAFLLTVSCKKSNSSGASGQVTASINGTAWANNVSTQGLYVSAASEFEIVGAVYKSGDSTALSVAFETPFPLNTPISSDTAGVDVEYIDAKTSLEYDGGAILGHSIITISSWDSVNHKISGTFSGVLYDLNLTNDSVVVTGGVFSSTYTSQ